MGAHVELRGFGWRHAGRRAWAVRGLDLRIERGERVLLLGPSGAGKSTLLAALAGLLPHDSGEQRGEVLIDGVDARDARDRTGIVFQDPQTSLVMSRAGDDVAFGLENRGEPAERIWPRVDAVLAAVGFPYGRDRPTAALSGGEQQRLALAGALVTRPALLLLDEPTANLDPAGAHLVRESLAHALVDADTTVVLVEHRVADFVPLVDRVVVLDPDGGITVDGPPATVFATYGDMLVAQGVWVPGRRLPDRHARHDPGPVLLRAEAAGHSRGPYLAPVSAGVRAGEVLAVTGPNGSGKTTLALLLGGLLAPDTGAVVATAQLSPTPAPHRWRAADLARRIGSVFQDPEQQFLRRTVHDELSVGGASKSTVDDLLVRLRLEKLARANPHTLSGGEQRRLSVATALASGPRVLILDEPTFGQDRRTWTEMVDLLAGVRAQGRAVVVVTHDADLVTALADRSMTLSVQSTVESR